MNYNFFTKTSAILVYSTPHKQTPLPLFIPRVNKVQVQIGFLIDDGWSELNKLMLSTMSGSYSTADNRGTFVKLDLDTE